MVAMKFFVVDFGIWPGFGSVSPFVGWVFHIRGGVRKSTKVAQNAFILLCLG